MNSTTVTVLVGIVGLIIGFLVGSTMSDNVDITDDVNPKSVTTQSTNNNNANVPTQNDGNVDSTLVSGEPYEVAFTIKVANLPSTQQQALKVMGVNDAEISITNGMVACAEAEVGAARVTEIKNGASVSISEGIVLMRCYSAS